MMDVVRSIGAFFMDLIEVVVISMSIFIVVYLFLMQPHQVKGSSMFPTFHDGEYLMTDKVTFKRRDPQVYDVVVFKAPLNENLDFIKRVVAEPGDRIMVKGGRLYRNGSLLPEPYLTQEVYTRPGQYLREGVEVVVPANSWIVVGDNRDHSSDSREWGPVPKENFIGRAFFRYWPFNKAGLIAEPTTATQGGRVFLDIA